MPKLRALIIVTIILIALTLLITYANLYLSPLPYTWSISDVSYLASMALCGNYAVLGYVNTNIASGQFQRFLIINLRTGHAMTIHQSLITNASSLIPQMAVNCNNNIINIVYTCIGWNNLFNNNVVGLCLIKVNASNGEVMSQYFLSSIYGNKSVIKYLGLSDGLIYGIVNDNIYVVLPFIDTYGTNGIINITCGDLAKILIGKNGTLSIAWEAPMHPCIFGMGCSDGRCSPMVNMINNYVVFVYEALNNTTGAGYARLVLINDLNGAVIYNANVTGMSSIISSTMIGNTLVYPCGDSLCGMEVMSNGTRLKFMINGLNGTVFNVGNYGLVLTQNYSGVSMVKISGNGSIIGGMDIPINLHAELGEYCSRLNLMSNGIALLAVYPCSISYGVYGYRELLAVINVTSGSVIHRAIRTLKIPIINTPSPSSIFPTVIPITASNKYFIYYFNGQLFITNEAQLINDWWYYALFDNIYLVMALWVITLIMIIVTIISVNNGK